MTAQTRALQHRAVIAGPTVVAGTNTTTVGGALATTVTVVSAFRGGAVFTVPEFVTDALSGGVLASSVGRTLLGTQFLLACPA